MLARALSREGGSDADPAGGSGSAETSDGWALGKGGRDGGANVARSPSVQKLSIGVFGGAGIGGIFDVSRVAAS